MRSIQRRFNSLKHKNLTSFVMFSNAIKGQRFSKGMISRWFNKLVDKDDYEKRDKKTLIKHLELLSNPIEDNVLLGQNMPKTQV